MKWSQTYFLALEMFVGLSIIADNNPDKISLTFLAGIMLVSMFFAMKGGK